MTLSEMRPRDTVQGMPNEETTWSTTSAARRLAHYASSVFGKWKRAGFAGALGAAVGIGLAILNLPLPWWGWPLIVAIALMIAQYEAFSGAMSRLDELREALARAKQVVATKEPQPSPPVALLTQLVAHGEALLASLTSKASKDPAEGDAKALQPAVDAWAEKCRSLLQEHWPAEVGTLDAESDQVFADTFFYGRREARLIGFMRPRIGNLKAILIRVS